MVLPLSLIHIYPFVPPRLTIVVTVLT